MTIFGHKKLRGAIWACWACCILGLPRLPFQEGCETLMLATWPLGSQIVQSLEILVPESKAGVFFAAGSLNKTTKQLSE